jgi:hypothetical protein
MKKWALLTVVLYAAILLALAGPVAYLSFVDEADPARLLKAVYYPTTGPMGPFEARAAVDEDGWVWFYCSPYLWAGVLGLTQALLLVVPIRVEGRRPATTRWLVWPALAALLMLALLAGAMLLVVSETVANTGALKGVLSFPALVAVVGAFWSVWAFVFAFYTVRGGGAGFMRRLCRSLVAGSILELLVAVPAHVLARSRNYCCAGFSTFWGIAAGVSVMLFAFGPAVFVLLARRYGGVRRSRSAGN